MGCIAEAANGSVSIEAIDLLIRIVDKVDAGAGNQELTTPVFVHARAGREGLSKQLLKPAVAIGAHDYLAPLLVRPLLRPIDKAPGRLQGADAAAAFGDR